MSNYVKVGAKVCITNVHGNASAERAADVGQCGRMLDEGRIGQGAGWDVYDIKLDSGRETFAHGFNLDLVKKTRKRR